MLLGEQRLKGKRVLLGCSILGQIATCNEVSQSEHNTGSGNDSRAKGHKLVVCATKEGVSWCEGCSG